MISDYKRMTECKTLAEVHDSPYFQKHFKERYIADIPRLAFEVFNLEMTYQQIDVTDNIDFIGGRMVVSSGHGCHGKDAEIMMSDGSIKKVQDIQEGEYLMGDDGRSKREVLSLARGQEEMFEFTFNDGSRRVYNKSHKLVLIRTQTKGKNLTGQQEIVTVGEWLSWSDSKKRAHAIEKSDIELPYSPVDIDPYLLGVWLGDGSSVRDYIWLGESKIHVSSHLNLHIMQTGRGCTRYRANIMEELRRLNLISNKHIPDDYKQNSKKVRSEILSGLLDSDGSVDARNGRVVEITQKRKNLLDDIKFIARSLGLRVGKTNVKTVKGIDYYRCSISGDLSVLSTKRLKLSDNSEGSMTSLRYGVKECVPLGVDNYYGFEVDGNNLYLDGGFIRTSNTGKTKLIGIIALAYMLLFRKSLVRVQAPKLEQVTKFTFKEINACLHAMKNRRKVNGKVYVSKWGFLADLIVANDTLFYAKGFKQSWYIEPATAPKGDPTNLSGQHNQYYLLIFDEMSGIPDTHVTGSLGGVSEEFNNCVGFSQHTRTTGKFHDFVTTQNETNGGVWRHIRLSSEKSPRVQPKEIEAWKSTYTDDEYRVRVLGRPPLVEEGFLINNVEAMSVYEKKGKKWIDKLTFHTVALSVDLAFSGWRDSGVITEARIATKEDSRGRIKLYVIIDEIKEYKGKLGRPRKTLGETSKRLLRVTELHETAREFKVAVDANSGGAEPYADFEDEITSSTFDNVDTYGLKWGSGRLSLGDRRRFVNQRAKAYVLLREAIEDGRFYVSTDALQQRVPRELSKIPFTYDARFKYKILSKQDMAKMGISSPDVADTFAQLFIIPITHFKDGDAIIINNDIVDGTEDDENTNSEEMEALPFQKKDDDIEPEQDLSNLIM